MSNRVSLRDIKSGEREQRSLIINVAYITENVNSRIRNKVTSGTVNHWYIGYFAFGNQFLGVISQEDAIWTRNPRQNKRLKFHVSHDKWKQTFQSNLICGDRRGSLDGGVQNVVINFTEAL